MAKELVPSPAVELIQAANVPELLQSVRPQWQAKNLIDRVHKLLNVDPSSACQRIFNAAMHDLREKIVIAGIDIAKEAAQQHKLPPINNNEDVENYSVSRLIDLSYRMGLLSRPEWRRVCRCYEIRRDLEHEDDQYEAGVEDCVYVFSTCIDVILSKDPIHLVKVTDFKELIEQGSSIVPDHTFLEDYQNAPQPRQTEILKFLISQALDKELSDLIQQNAFTCISYLKPITQSAVLVEIGQFLQEKAGRTIDPRMARVAQAAGVFPYLRQTAKLSFFEGVFENMRRVGVRWTAHGNHGELLRSLKEYGGLDHCPSEIRSKIVKWMILTYIGEPGGRTSYGNVRHVYYSNSAAPLIREIFKNSPNLARQDVESLLKDRDVKNALLNEHIERRLEEILDILETRI